MMKNYFPLETILALVTGFYLFDKEQRIFVSDMLDFMLGERMAPFYSDKEFEMCKSEVLRQYPSLTVKNHNIASGNDILILYEQGGILERMQKKFKEQLIRGCLPIFSLNSRG